MRTLANVTVPDAITAQEDAQTALDAIAASQPIYLLATTDAINESGTDILENSTLYRLVGRVETQYTAGATATATLHHDTNPTTFDPECVWDIGGKAVGEEWEIMIDAKNLTYVRYLRITIGGTPSAGASRWMLSRSNPPV